VATVDLPKTGNCVLWIDPVVDMTRPLPSVELEVKDSAGNRSIQMETAFADNGDVIALAEFTPREQGEYDITTNLSSADVLAQDRWDAAVSARAKGKLTAPLREGVELFVRYPPDKIPTLSAVLRNTYQGKIVNLLRNGNFEEGVPGCPPRGWTVSHPRRDDPGWPGWSQEDPFEGESCLKFVRPKESVSAVSQPMRLRTSGRYVLRFQAKGNTTTASVSISGQRGTTARVEIEPSKDWRAYRTELDAETGHCLVSINMARGGERGQMLWVDDMEFGYIEGPH
jgi:hypothetical protein